MNIRIWSEDEAVNIPSEVWEDLAHRLAKCEPKTVFPPIFAPDAPDSYIHHLMLQSTVKAKPAPCEFKREWPTEFKE